MRVSRSVYSETANPSMLSVAQLAGFVRRSRQALPSDHRYVELEREAIEAVSTWLDERRRLRDHILESTFSAFYGSPR